MTDEEITKSDLVAKFLAGLDQNEQAAVAPLLPKLFTNIAVYLYETLADDVTDADLLPSTIAAFFAREQNIGARAVMLAFNTILAQTTHTLTTTEHVK